MKIQLPALLVTLAGPAAGQGLSTCYVTDPTDDAVYVLRDLDFDGDANDAGEVALFYDDTQGDVPLQLNTGIDLGPGGTLYVCDGGADQIIVLFDANSDGDANDAGEASVFFDAATNASGVAMSNAQDLTYDPATGIVWVANAGSTGGVDSILRLEDLNADGDAEDLGEAVVWYLPAPGGANGDSVPQHVMIGPDANVYYVDSSSTGVVQKGVYRLEDLDNSGTIDQPNEVTTFYAPGNLQTGFPTHLIFASDGYWYLSDQLADNVRRFQDVNLNGVIDAGTEDSIWFTATGGSTLWEIGEAPDGSMYALESQTPDRLLRLDDADDSGAIDAGEFAEVYDENLAALAIGNPRGLAIDPTPLGSAFAAACQGDGGVSAGCTPCPCGNDALAGTEGGCLNPEGRSARLIGDGTASVAGDTLRFTLEGGSSTTFGVLVSGDAVAPTNAANPCFGQQSGVVSVVLDGLRCAVQSTLRHGSRSTDATGAIGTGVPGPGQNGWGPPSGPVGGLVAQAGFASGQTRWFQVFYRTDDTLGCTTGQNTSQVLGVTIQN